MSCCTSVSGVCAPQPVKLSWDGDLLDEEILGYKAHFAQLKHPAKVAAQDLYDCCKYDLVNRAAVLLKAVPSEKWMPVFADLAGKITTSALVFALMNRSCKVARLLIDLEPKMIMTSTLKGPYEGATIIHLLVGGNQSDLLDLVMGKLSESDRLYLVNHQASGVFSKEVNKYSHPLLIGVNCGFLQIYRQLIKYGACLDARNKQDGNTIIHSILDYGVCQPDAALDILKQVLHGEDALDWYSRTQGVDRRKMTSQHIRNLHWMLLKAENKEGYTPLTYAAKLNVYSLLNYLLKTEGVYRYTVWRTGPKSLSEYDMAEIDPVIAAAVRPKRPNVLDQLLYGSKMDFIQTVNEEPVYSLMQLKWVQLRVLFYSWAVTHLGIIIMISYISALRTDYIHQATLTAEIINKTLEEVYTSDAFMSMEDMDSDQTTYEIFTAIVLTTIHIYLLVEVYDIVLSLIMLVRNKLFWKQMGYYKASNGVIAKSDEFDVIILAFCLTTIASFVSDFIGYERSADTFLAIALVTGWYYILFFARAYKPTSYFSLMVNRILSTDVLKFGVVMVIIVVAFSAAIQSLLRLPAPEGFTGFTKSSLTLFYLVIGLGDVGFTDTPPNTMMLKITTIVFIVLTMVSLLNMLIAAMTDTYEGISQNRDAIARKLRLASALILERRIPSAIMNRILHRKMKYSEELGTYLLPVHEDEQQDHN